MDIIITDTETLEEIQTRFTSHFPYLKLEFYNREHEEGEGNSNDAKLEVSKRLSEIRSVHNTGELSIHGNQKVSTLEQAFHDHYGLNAQVFRKSGEVCLQTTATDSWTLSEQNQTAEEHAV